MKFRPFPLSVPAAIPAAGLAGLLFGALVFSSTSATASAQGTSQPDYMDTVVNGPSDLIDFFPLFLDIKQLLTVLPPGPSIKYKLKQEESGLNFVYTSLTRANSAAYKSPDASTGYGPNFDQAAAEATTEQITAAGVELSAAFLSRIKDQDQGVILLEMRGKVGKPLKLVVEKDNVQISEVVVNLASWRFYADAGKIHLGFDPPNKGEEEDRAAPTVYWASVVEGETNTILNLQLPSTGLAGVRWEIEAGDETKVDITPTTFTTETTDITISGFAIRSNVPEATVIRLVDNEGIAEPILTLNVLVLPRREMGLAIYTLEDPNAPLTQFASAPAVDLPSNAEILAACNDSFVQAGVRFTLHPSSGAYSFPYDTRGLSFTEGYSEALPVRVSDGRLGEDEANILAFPFGARPAVADTIFPVPRNDPNVFRIIIVKESGLAYMVVDPDTGATTPTGQMKRGDSSGVFIFARNLPHQIPLAIAHEVGHKLGLSTAKEDGDHDQPPFAHAVVINQPNGSPPVFPGNDLFQHRPKPNRALMQSGTPAPDGLPWVYGRWMRRQDWDKANRTAGGVTNAP